MTQLKEDAIKMIQAMPDENMVYIVSILENLEGMTKNVQNSDNSAAMKAYYDIMDMEKLLPDDFDAKKELAMAKEEKYDHLG